MCELPIKKRDGFSRRPLASGVTVGYAMSSQDGTTKSQTNGGGNSCHFPRSSRVERQPQQYQDVPHDVSH